MRREPQVEQRGAKFVLRLRCELRHQAALEHAVELTGKVAHLASLSGRDALIAGNDIRTDAHMVDERLTGNRAGFADIQRNQR